MLQLLLKIWSGGRRCRFFVSGLLISNCLLLLLCQNSGMAFSTYNDLLYPHIVGKTAAMMASGNSISRASTPSSSSLWMTDDHNNNNHQTTSTTTSTTLVVGATGRIGCRVVEELLNANQTVRAIVRNYTNAVEILDTTNPNLEVIVCDLGLAAKSGVNATILENAVKGCNCILSLSGCLRYSHWTDFVLPWRTIKFDVSRWADAGHPYYGNYKAQQLLIDLAKHYNIQRFVRITGLSAGLPAFHPVSMIFGSIVSLSNRYHYACEQYLRYSQVPYLILRPGGMVYQDRDPNKAYLQVDPSGSLPAPASKSRIARSDVVALAVAAATTTTTTSSTNDSDSSSSTTTQLLLPKENSYTLAIRDVGEMEDGKIQGSKQDGYETALKCLEVLTQNDDDQPIDDHTSKSIQQQQSSSPSSLEKKIRNKPYGLAVTIFVYSLTAIAIKVTTQLMKGIWSLLFKFVSLVS